MTSTTAQSVVIIGGGPAGLAAAYRLTRQGNRVTLIDRRPLLGGTAISEDPRDTAEPFTILGCHRATHTLLHALHPGPQQPSEAEIPLEFHLPDDSLVHYPRTYFPAPLHTWMNLLKFSGIPWKERWRLASWVEKLWEGDERLPADLEQRTADEWLASIKQTARTRRVVWNPLARWLTGNDLSTMSADAFVTSMKPLFLKTRLDSRISVVQDSLQICVVQPITEALTQVGATMLRNTEATQLRYERDRHLGRLAAGWFPAASRLVCGSPAPSTAHALTSRAMADSLRLFSTTHGIAIGRQHHPPCGCRATLCHSSPRPAERHVISLGTRHSGNTRSHTFLSYHDRQSVRAGPTGLTS